MKKTKRAPRHPALRRPQPRLAQKKSAEAFVYTAEDVAQHYLLVAVRIYMRMLRLSKLTLKANEKDIHLDVTYRCAEKTRLGVDKKKSKHGVPTFQKATAPSTVTGKVRR